MFSFKIFIILLIFMSPVFAGTIVLMNIGTGTPTANDLLVDIGLPMYSIGTTPILVK